jgi:hypothetical protein
LIGCVICSRSFGGLLISVLRPSFCHLFDVNIFPKCPGFSSSLGAQVWPAHLIGGMCCVRCFNRLVSFPEWIVGVFCLFYSLKVRLNFFLQSFLFGHLIFLSLYFICLHLRDADLPAIFFGVFVFDLSFGYLWVFRIFSLRFVFWYCSPNLRLYYVSENCNSLFYVFRHFKREVES